MRIPPPLVALITILLLLGSAYVWPGLSLGGSWIAGLVLVLLGLALTISSARRFHRAGTTLNPIDVAQASALVTSGSFRYSRNPMYLGMAVVITGTGIWTGHAALLILLPAFILWINRFQIAPEEAAMHQKFGQDYADYCARVRRWI